MSLYFLIVVCAFSCASAGTLNYWTQTDATKCDPVCSCYMDGVYYDEGENWTKPEEPCTIYKCFKNGFYKAVYTGCDFKGQCKDVGQKWSEGCFTYECVDAGLYRHYRLLEAGCMDEQGKCWKVGDNVKQGCNVFECQIQGTCYKMVKCKEDCTVDGGCKPVDSFWHDGCRVYTCTSENDKVYQRVLQNEIMQWPKGQYAMLKPKHGCPVDVDTDWKDGFRKHYGVGSNYYSDDFDLFGQYTAEFMENHFCVHETVQDSSRLPRYQTYWEPGRYCLLGSGGRCPFGFSAGYVLMDDADDKVHLAQNHGVLPDGEFADDTGLTFCCRRDGQVADEIVLPKENPFVLFMAHGDNKCQEVRGMNHTTEFMVFDNDNYGQYIIQNGSLPAVKDDNNRTMLYFCYYKPLECGCTDKEGNFIALNSERTKDCVTEKCISDFGFNVLQVVSGGCPYNGKCKDVGETWSEVHGESCLKQTCAKVTNNSTTSFKIQDLGHGCRDEDVCRDVGYEKFRGCYTSVCKMDPATKSPAFRIVKAGCSNMEGNCVPVGALVLQGCIQFRCVRQPSRCGLRLVRGDCPWIDSCKPVNSTWTHGCMKYRCDMTITGNNYQWQVHPIVFGCSDGDRCYKIGQKTTGRCYEAICKLTEDKTKVYLDVVKGGCSWQGKCRDVNETWKEGCHDYKCVWQATDTGFIATVNATKVSCTWKNSCRDADEVWSEGCVDYVCDVTRNESQVNWRVKALKLACQDHKGNCLGVGESIEENCVTYRCSHEGMRLSLEVGAAGCEWNGTCKPENSKWTNSSNCVDYQCKMVTVGGKKRMQQSPVSYGCMWKGTCKENGARWTEGCYERSCVIEDKGDYIHKKIDVKGKGCNDNGACRPLGYKKKKDACLEYECKYNKLLRIGFFELSKGECKGFSDGKCHGVNSTWTEHHQSTCIKLMCVQERNVFRTKLLEQMCLAANGKCQPIGATNFDIENRGQIRRNCACLKGRGNGVSIRCSGPDKKP